MSKYLYSLGKFAYNNSKKVLLAWIIIIVVLAGLILNVGGGYKGDVSIPGTKSEKAMTVLKDNFQQGKEYGYIRVVFKAEDGKTLITPEAQKIIKNTLENIKQDANVTNITDMMQSHTISPKLQIGYVDVTYKQTKDDVKKSSIEHIKESMKIAESSGMKTGLSGSVELSKENKRGSSEGLGIAVALIILTISMASLITAGLPIISAIIGLSIGLMSVYLSTNFFKINSASSSLGSMICIAVGIDYSLFILSRYRDLLKSGMDKEDAAAKANATSGTAVVFAALTVIIALSGLVIVGIPFLSAMGLAAAFCVLMAMLVSITVTPALLKIAGKYIKPTRDKKILKSSCAEGNLWANFVTKHPIIILLCGILLTATIAIPAKHINLGLPDNGIRPKDSVERKGYDLLTEGFGEGFNGPLAIVIDMKDSTNKNQTLQKTTEMLSKLKNVSYVSPAIKNESGNYALMSILPKTGPHDIKTKTLVRDIRDSADGIKKEQGIKLMVTGTTAVNIDISDKLGDAFPKFVAFIVIFALILLTIVFRSIIIPIKATLGFVATIFATLGFVVFVIQDGNLSTLFGIAESAPILNFMPIFTTGILFGLAMDYEFFLVTRMKEEFTHTENPVQSIISGIKGSGAVVVTAGLIMTFVFASFGFTNDITLKTMSISLAFGIVFDAFLIRLSCVPAAMTLLGKKAWYIPKWLDRILPEVDIEGNKLSNEIPAHLYESSMKNLEDLEHLS